MMAGSHGRMFQKVKARPALRSRQCSADRIASLYFSPIPRAAFIPLGQRTRRMGAMDKCFGRSEHIWRADRGSAQRTESRHIISRRSRGRHLHHVEATHTTDGSDGQVFRKVKAHLARPSPQCSPFTTASRFFSLIPRAAFIPLPATHTTDGSRGQVSQKASALPARISAQCSLDRIESRCSWQIRPAAFTPHPATLMMVGSIGPVSRKVEAFPVPLSAQC